MNPYKKYSQAFLLAVSLLAGFEVSGQSKLYIKPSAGIGFTHTREKYKVSGLTYESPIDYNAGIGIGYQKNKLRLETGLGYLHTRQNVNGLIFQNEMGSLESADISFSAQYLILPLRVAYKLKLGNKFSLYPAIAANIALNYKVQNKVVLTSTDSVLWKANYSLKNLDRPVGILGEIRMDATYTVNEHFELFGGPAFQYLLTTIGSNPVFDTHATQYAWGINIGINIYLPKETKQADTPQN